MPFLIMIAQYLCWHSAHTPYTSKPSTFCTQARGNVYHGNRVPEVPSCAASHDTTQKHERDESSHLHHEQSDAKQRASPSCYSYQLPRSRPHGRGVVLCNKPWEVYVTVLIRRSSTLCPLLSDNQTIAMSERPVVLNTFPKRDTFGGILALGCQVFWGCCECR